MRKTFTMTPAQRDKLLDAMRPVPAMWIGGPPRSVQQNANDAWVALGQEMGFDGLSVRGIPGGSELEFSAEEAPITRAAPLSPGDAEYLSWRPAGVGACVAPRYSPFDLWFAEWELILPQDAREAFRQVLDEQRTAGVPEVDRGN